jgi:hypothetical protein
MAKNYEKTFTLADALISLVPTAKWTARNSGTYAEIEWNDTEQELPSEEILVAEVARLQAEFDSKKYQRLRAVEYPPMTDQLDMIFHNGIDAWKEQIQAVKDMYPKPEGE